MDDITAVAAMRNGESMGLETIYRRYADRLYDYCVALLRDPELAADAVHDTFLIASRRIDDLRDPERLRPWLYTIARREALRASRARRHLRTLDPTMDPAAATTDPGARVFEDQVRDLMTHAMRGLSANDHEVIALALRHDLSPAQTAEVLGVSPNHAHARLSRARQSLLKALGALTVARHGCADCDDLADMLRTWDGVLTERIRKQINRHVDACATCGETQRDRLNPTDLLRGYAILPFLAMPAVAAATADDSDADLEGGESASTHPVGVKRRRRVMIACGVATVLVTSVTAMVAARASSEKPIAADVGTSSAALPENQRTGPAGPEALSPNDATTATPGSRASTEPQPTVEGSPPTGRPGGPGGPSSATPDPFSATASGTVECGSSITYRLVVATNTTEPIRQALLYWTVPTVDRERMTRTSATSTRAVVSGLTTARLTWWVQVDAIDGRRFTTPVRVLTRPCAAPRRAAT